MYCTSKWQNATTEIQVPWMCWLSRVMEGCDGKIKMFKNSAMRSFSLVRVSWTKGMIRRLIWLMQYWIRLIVPWSQKGTFKHRKFCRFKIDLLIRSSPLAMNLGYERKIAVKYNRKRWDFCEVSTAWNLATKCADVRFAKPWALSSCFEQRYSSFDELAAWQRWPMKHLWVESHLLRPREI